MEMCLTLVCPPGVESSLSTLLVGTKPYDTVDKIFPLIYGTVLFSLYDEPDLSKE